MSEVKMSITVEMVRTLNALSGLEQTQIPFALAQSLTSTAEASRQAVGIQTRRTFKLHGEFIPKGVRKTMATKKKLVASVYTAPGIDGFMPDQEHGADRSPHSTTVGGGVDKARSMALPGEGLVGKVFKTGTGAVKRTYKPAVLLEKQKAKTGKRLARKLQGVTRGGSRSAVFMIRLKSSGIGAIVRRKGKARYPLEVLYIFARKAHIKKQWNFEKTVRKTANAVFEKKFGRFLASAIDSIK